MALDVYDYEFQPLRNFRAPCCSGIYSIHNE